MTLMAHKMLDAYAGRDPKYKFRLYPGADPEMAAKIMRAVEQAEKFDFGDLMLEQAGEISTGPVFKSPELTTEERKFWIDGLIPLPAPMCWYEDVVNGYRTGSLVVDHGGDDGLWTATIVDRVGDEFLFPGVTLSAARHRSVPFKDPAITASGNTRHLVEMQRRHGQDFVGHGYGFAIPQAIYLTLMINSRSTEVVSSTPPLALNKARIASGKTPLFAHRVVNIVPQRFVRDSEAEAKGSHRSPRLHWRRSHLRYFDHPTAMAKPMGDRFAVVIPRALVGKAELGAVSHEYRIKGPKA